MFKKRPAKDRALEGLAHVALIPAKRWVYGWALEIVGGPSITRLESAILVLAVSVTLSALAVLERAAFEEML